jgi:hypothetical protein
MRSHLARMSNRRKRQLRIAVQLRQAKRSALLVGGGEQVLLGYGSRVADWPLRWGILLGWVVALRWGVRREAGRACEQKA